jgi:hypothetical protein
MAQENIREYPQKVSAFPVFGYRTYLTFDHNFFEYNYSPRGNSEAINACRAITNFDKITQEMELFLANNDSLRAGMFLSLPAWAGVYAGRSDRADKHSASYVLSLMFLSQFSRAESAAKEILAQKPDDYGTLLLLGLLAIYDRANFPYLERAFVMNPYKTMWMLNWHLDKIFITPKTDWDFVQAYADMLIKHKDKVRELQLPPQVVMCLYQSFSQKLASKEKHDPEMLNLILIFRPKLNRDTMRYTRQREKRNMGILKELKESQESR